ncbi:MULTISPECIES: hypothetical protein [unclassified Colwellia]|nr:MULTISPECIES: hypothetical protein [unclassified Colwellia]MBA6354727.1 hypothetical protein [Colwellia sp. BRX8-3]MBA6360010.1 hypothetical protein [Colwellia sp. BRX8-6]MBA6366486.1 hypothetical protein [Colwellia sp. BRX8-5]MBA6375570.1 hypothetical protein [Colwellia sp. BRX8-2]MBA6380050.1 hypothetical protein [Colwellia sp. BRX10-7]
MSSTLYNADQFNCSSVAERFKKYNDLPRPEIMPMIDLSPYLHGPLKS